MESLASRNCIPCRGDTPRLSGARLAEMQQQLAPGWRTVDQHHLEKEFRFRNFREALVYANAVGAIAEQQGHHPDMLVSWGKVTVTIWTHKIDGLTESDFILAAKVSRKLTSSHASLERQDLARPAGLKPAATSLEGSCSIQLSYGRVLSIVPKGRTPNAPPDAALDRKPSICARKTLAEWRGLALEGPCSVRDLSEIYRSTATFKMRRNIAICSSETYPSYSLLSRVTPPALHSGNP
jgi:4a-hydroxytetrahydrobiopterin dehydratase